MVPRGATDWHLPGLVLVCGLLAGGLLIAFGGTPAAPAPAPDVIPAIVVDSTPCGPVEARDTVQIMVEGRSERVALDGCGNPVGTELEVERGQDGSPMRLAGTGLPASGGLADRISMLLLVLAGLAGALLALVVPSRQR